MAGHDTVRRDACQRMRLSLLAIPPDQPAGTNGHGDAGPYPGAIQPQPWQLCSPENDAKGKLGCSSRPT
jgi:hypothetical protein